MSKSHLILNDFNISANVFFIVLRKYLKINTSNNETNVLQVFASKFLISKGCNIFFFKCY